MKDLNKDIDIISYFNDSLTLFNSDNTLSADNHFKLRGNIYILINRLSKYFDNRMTIDEIENAFFIIKKMENPTIEELINKVCNSKNIKKYQFNIAFSFNISKELIIEKLNKEIKCININDYINRYVESNEYLKSENKNSTAFSFQIKNMKWFIIPMYGNNENEAFNKAQENIENLRALINIGIDYKRIHYQSKPMQISTISPSKYYFIFDSKNEYVNSYKTTEDFNYTNYSINENEESRIMEFNKQINKSKGDIKITLKYCLQLYLLALDNSIYTYSFFVFWSIIETFLPNVDSRILCLKNLYKLTAKREREIIDIVYHKRNISLHQGKYDSIDINDLNFCKQIVDVLLSFVFLISSSFSSLKDIEQILKRMNTKDALMIEMKYIEFINSKIFI